MSRARLGADPACRRWMREQLDAGRIRHRDHVVSGLENAPAALADVLAGRGHGRTLVRL